jgi:hypothetical protein
LRAVGHGQVDLVDGDRVTVAGSIRLALQELLVVVVVMKLVETGRQAKIGQLDMAAAVEQDIIWLDISLGRGSAARALGTGGADKVCTYL